MQTVLHLEKLGIHDRYLWKLQELVAARIRALDLAQHAAI
jgi:cation transport regulator ChaC